MPYNSTQLRLTSPTFPEAAALLAVRVTVFPPRSLRHHVLSFCARAVRRLSRTPPPGESLGRAPSFADIVTRTDARLVRIRKFCCNHRHPPRSATFAAVLKVFGEQIASRFSDRPRSVVKRIAREALTNWVMNGPARADGTPRFSSWNAEAVAFALTRLRRLRPRLRDRSFPMPGGGTVTIFERRHFHAPRSLWLMTLPRCAQLDRTAARIESADVVPATPSAPVPVAASPWDSLARDFAQHAADARARLTATWGNARHRAALAEAALVAVQAWLKAGAQRLARMLGVAADLPAALLRRTERAKAAEVHVFALWPASLLRAVRRALDLVTVVRVEVRQTVEVFA